MSKFVWRQNVEHYVHLLSTEKDEGPRQRIRALRAEGQ